ncbi:MAG: translation initiation factor IF-2 [Phycisphaerae bacterium]
MAKKISIKNVAKDLSTKLGREIDFHAIVEWIKQDPDLASVYPHPVHQTPLDIGLVESIEDPGHPDHQKIIAINDALHKAPAGADDAKSEAGKAKGKATKGKAKGKTKAGETESDPEAAAQDAPEAGTESEDETVPAVVPPDVETPVTEPVAPVLEASAHVVVEPGDVPVTPEAVVVSAPVAHTGHHEVAPEAHPAPASEAPAVEVPAKPIRPLEKPKKPVAARGKPNVVNKPTVVPVSNMVQPKPAQMKGPQVVRIEEADRLPAPRPRPRPMGSDNRSSSSGPNRGPNNGPGGPQSIPMPASTGRSGSTHKKSAAAIEKDEEESRKARARLARRKGGRSADAGVAAIREWREQDLADRAERIATAVGTVKERKREMSKSERAQVTAQAVQHKPEMIEIELPISLRDLAELMGVKVADLIRKLMAQGVMATANQAIEADTAQLMCMEYGIELHIKQKRTASEMLREDYDAHAMQVEQVPRQAIVTILGHVDHGKTSLLDKIRTANVAAGEAGGITQHVGAYVVEVMGGDGKPKRVTFLDTPGHQAFTAMRARGATMTDVVVLVVAADDGVMPQTIESIAHAKAAGVPIVVAMNKIDKAEANPMKVMGQLAEHGLNPTEWGGDTEVVKTSALTGQGIKELIEYLDYTATLRDLKAAPSLPARGSVVEAFVDPNRGVIVRLLVQNGTLRTGDYLVCGPAHGRVRSLTDDLGRTIKEAGPSLPVEVVGLSSVPTAGEQFYVTPTPEMARTVADDRAQQDRLGEIAKRHTITLENLYSTLQDNQIKELRVILKADVQGSLDAIKSLLNQEFGGAEVKIHMLHAAVGGISESDVLLADASKAIIVGFSVVPDESARKLAESTGVEIRAYRIIYEIADDIRKAMSGLLSPEKQEHVLGHAEVRLVYKISRIGNVAGCAVTDGVLQRACKYRLIRDGAVLVDNLLLDSLKRGKEDAKEVRGGFECGVKVAGYDDLKEGDRLEAYKTVEVARTL